MNAPCSVTFLATDDGTRASIFHIYLDSSKGVIERIADIAKVSDIQDKVRGFNPLKAARNFLGKKKSKIFEGFPNMESDDTFVVSCVAGKMRVDIYTNKRGVSSPFKFGKSNGTG